MRNSRLFIVGLMFFIFSPAFAATNNTDASHTAGLRSKENSTVPYYALTPDETLFKRGNLVFVDATNHLIIIKDGRYETGRILKVLDTSNLKLGDNIMVGKYDPQTSAFLVQTF